MGHRAATHATMLELPWEEGPLLGGGSGGGGGNGGGGGSDGGTGGGTGQPHRAPSPAAEPAPPRPSSRGWHAGTLAALDLETTGRDPKRDRVLGVALYLQQPGQTPQPVIDTLVDPGSDVEIPAEAAAVHGITREVLQAEAAPALGDVLPAIHDALVECVDAGTGVVIYNAPFDWPFLAAELARLTPPRWLPSCRLVDPLVLDRHVDRYRKGKRTLEAACEVYGATLDQAHDAGADARACLQVARAIGDRYPEVGSLPLDELVELQTQAHTQWRDGFNAYLRRIGADRDPVSGTWPGIPEDVDVVAVTAGHAGHTGQTSHGRHAGQGVPASTSAR